MTAAICSETGIRRAACVCAYCAAKSTAAQKHAANLQDAQALLGMIRSALDFERHRPRWDAVGDVANARRALLEVLTGLTGYDGPAVEASLERRASFSSVAAPVDLLWGEVR